MPKNQKKVSKFIVKLLEILEVKDYIILGIKLSVNDKMDFRRNRGINRKSNRALDQSFN